MALDDIRQKNNCPKAVRFYSMTERMLEDKKITARKRLNFTMWCGRRDSNSHTSRRQNLNLVRLPISPRPLKNWDYTDFVRLRKALGVIVEAYALQR